MTKSALIVWGGWEGHEPKACAKVVKDILSEHGFDVTISDTTAAFADPALSDFDLITPMITQSTIEKDELTNLIAAIRGGTGLGGCHGQMCDAFRNETDYQFMVGGQWVAHPGNIMDYEINVTKPNDPIMAGIGDFAYHSEQYFVHYDPSIDILATTRFDGSHFAEIDGVEIPVVWKRQYGKGRVFHSTLGHIAEEFKVPQMRTILERGLLWAAR